MTTSLKSLVQEARQLTSHILPSAVTSGTPVERGLDQIEASTKRLLRRTTARAVSNQPQVTDGADGSGLSPTHVNNDLAAPPPDSRTAYLLASRGIDADRALHTLADINLALSFEPLQAIPDTDIDAYLRHEHETLVSLAVQETISRTLNDFEDHFEKSLQKSWARDKRKIMESMGHHSTTSASHAFEMDQDMKFPAEQYGKSVTGGMVATGGISQNPRLKAYLSVIKDMSNSRSSSGRYNAGVSFLRASEKTAVEPPQIFISSCWSLLLKMLGIDKDNAGQVEAGYFTEVFKNSLKAPTSGEAIKYRSKLVEGSRKWLESSFESWLNQHVRDQHSEIGGKPSIHTLVDAYLKIKFFRNGRWNISWLEQNIGKVPFWAHMFVLVRMGKLREAADYVEKYSHDLLASKDANFIKYFKEWATSGDQKLSKKTRDLLIGDWTSRIRDILANTNSSPKGDVFKYALYKIIGRCEMNVKAIRNSEVISTTDDYLWVHIMLISEAPGLNEPSFEKYTLRDFSASMQKFGKAYFKRTDTWFMVLLLCGEYEKAVSELSLEPSFAGDALHFACAMAYYGVLRVPDSPKAIPLSNSLLSVSKTKIENAEYDTYYFHFARIIAQFVQEWCRSDPTDVFYYIYLLGLYGASLDSIAPHGVPQKDWDNAKDYTRFIYSLIRDNLTQTKNLTQLLGQLRSDGLGRNTGSIEKYRTLIHLNSEQEFLDRIVLTTAEQCDHEARFKDALELYNLAGQPNKVIELLIRQISESLISRTISQTTPAALGTSASTKSMFENEEDPVETASRVLDYYQSRQQESSLIDPKIAYTCRTLVTISKFLSLSSQGQIERALEVFYSLDLVATSNDMNLIQKKAIAFNSLNENVCKVIPSTLLEVVTCLSKLHQIISQGRFSERDSRLREIKGRTKAILSFCGLIQYQIPQDIFSRMNRMDSLL